MLVQAGQYYHFAGLTLLAIGLVFKSRSASSPSTAPGSSPPGSFGTTATQSTCGAVAAILPGDAITLVLETVPLYLLFEASVLLV